MHEGAREHFVLEVVLEAGKMDKHVALSTFKKNQTSPKKNAERICGM